MILLGAGVSWAGTLVPVDVQPDREASLVDRLETSGIPAIGWSNADVEISDFHGLLTVPVAGLQGRLTPGDPRWDPWLEGLPVLFHPKPGVSRIWVDLQNRDKALATLGADALGSSPGMLTPLSVTGWGVVGFSLLYLILKIVSVWASGPVNRGLWRSWVWVPAVVVLFCSGVFLGAFTTSAAVEKRSPDAPAWSRHRWFQESLPYGAVWKDWIPGKSWSYPSYAIKEGRLSEIPVVLPSPDPVWFREAFSRLDSHHAARIFGPENP